MQGCLCLCASRTALCQAACTSEQWLQNEEIRGLKVNKLSSAKTQLPYEFYSLPYCRPEKIESSAENLGEVLRGDRIVNSLYKVRNLVVCTLCAVRLQLTV